MTYNTLKININNKMLNFVLNIILIIILLILRWNMSWTCSREVCWSQWLKVCVLCVSFWGPIQCGRGSGWRWQDWESLWEHNTTLQRLPSESCWAAESAQWAVWRHRKRITGVDIQRYSESAIKHIPLTVTKAAHLHDTECFWCHQNTQN